MTDKLQVDPEPEASPEKREAARLRKQKQRSREKVEKIQAVLEEKKGSVANEEWWDLNRKTLSVKKRQEMLAREVEVGGLIVMMMSYLAHPPEGDSEDAEILRQLIENIQRDVKKHGLSCSGAMSIPNLCRTHTQVMQGDNSPATKDAVMFGFLTGIPSQLHVDFMLKFTKSNPKCTMPGCPNPQGNLEIWFCDQHAIDRANRTKAHRGAAPIPLEDRPYMVGGRLYPSGEI